MLSGYVYSSLGLIDFDYMHARTQFELVAIHIFDHDILDDGTGWVPLGERLYSQEERQNAT